VLTAGAQIAGERVLVAYLASGWSLPGAGMVRAVPRRRAWPHEHPHGTTPTTTTAQDTTTPTTVTATTTIITMKHARPPAARWRRPRPGCIGGRGLVLSPSAWCCSPPSASVDRFGVLLVVRLGMAATLTAAGLLLLALQRRPGAGARPLPPGPGLAAASTAPGRHRRAGLADGRARRWKPSPARLARSSGPSPERDFASSRSWVAVLRSSGNTDNRGGRNCVAKHQRADETYLRVLHSSAGLFAERGFLGTSVNDLLERAGLTKNAFYSYFPSKEGLAVAIVEHTASQWPPMIATFEALRAPAVDTVIALSFEVADRYSTDVIVRAGIRLSLERDTIKTPLPPPFHGWVEEIERLLSPAGEWELMGLAAPADVAARVIVRDFGERFERALVGDGNVDMTKRLAEVWTVILPGLRPTPDPAARIATAQALRERARFAAVNSAPTTMVRMVDPSSLDVT
jgi:AcrR family transcriptional regulator